MLLVHEVRSWCLSCLCHFFQLSFNRALVLSALRNSSKTYKVFQLHADKIKNKTPAYLASAIFTLSFSLAFSLKVAKVADKRR